MRIVSWNVLAQQLARAATFPYCDRATLDWKQRKSRLCEALDALDADVLCLQELCHYKNHWRKHLEARGYATVYVETQPNTYGLCIAWKRKSLRQLAVRKVFYRHAELTTETNRNAAILVRLERLPDGPGVGDSDVPDRASSFTVATTHLYWAPDVNGRDATCKRLSQLLVLSEALMAFGAVSLNDGSDCALSNEPIFLCGDFNSTPESLPMRVVLGGRGNCEDEDDDEGDADDDDDDLNGSEDVREIVQRLHKCTPCWRSALALEPRPHITNSTETFQGCIDYVLVAGDVDNNGANVVITRADDETDVPSDVVDVKINTGDLFVKNNTDDLVDALTHNIYSMRLRDTPRNSENIIRVIDARAVMKQQGCRDLTTPLGSALPPPLPDRYHPSDHLALLVDVDFVEA